jgi:hypothetical protein
MARDNQDREPLNSIEMGRAYYNLVAPVEKGGAGLETLAVAKRFQVSPATVLTYVGALDLPKSWREKIIADELGFTQVKALVKYSEDRQVLNECERNYVQEPWAWRSAKDFVRSVEFMREKLRGEKPKRRADDEDRPVVAPARPKAASVGVLPAASGPSTRSAPTQTAAIAPSNGAPGATPPERRVAPPPLPLGRRPLPVEDEGVEPAGAPPSDGRFADVENHEFFGVLKPFLGDRRALESIGNLALQLAARVGAKTPPKW